ncbi:MAG: hypothetical protein VYB44_06035 [Bacteroidota bacterium]|nr:hypothetical protein [Bacteroidota bacterium]
MKKLIASALLLSLCLMLHAQDCTQDPNAQKAKNNIGKPGSSPVCANAAQFFAYLCACKNKPRTAEQARMLKATLEQIKSSYDSYGSPCAGLSLPSVPNCLVGSANGSAEDNSSPFIEANYLEVMQYGAELDQLTEEFSNRLQRINGLVSTNDPTLSLMDFNRKMKDLEYVQQDIAAAKTKLITDGLQSLGDAIQNNNQTGFYKGIGAFANLLEMKQAKKEAAARKAQLQQQQRSQMSQIYWDAYHKIVSKTNDFLTLAAYAEDPAMEAYYLAMVDNLNCYQESLRSNWNPNTTDWLNNNCPLPTKPAAGIPNNLIPEEKKTIQIAQRKNDYFENAIHGQDMGMEIRIDPPKYVDARTGMPLGTPTIKIVNVTPGGLAYQQGFKPGTNWTEIITSSTGIDLSREEMIQYYQSQLQKQKDLKTNVLNLIESIRNPDKNGIKYRKTLKRTDEAAYEKQIASDSSLVQMNISNLTQIQSLIDQYQGYVNQLKSSEDISDFPAKVFALGYATMDEAELLVSYLKRNFREIWNVTGPRVFKQSAIDFASKAATLNPSAENYLRMAKYLEDENEIIALNYLLEAFRKDSSLQTSEEDFRLRLTQKIQSSIRSHISVLKFIGYGSTEEQIEEAKSTLTSFVSSGFHKTIKLNKIDWTTGNSESLDVLHYAIATNNPAGMQVLLNAYVEGLDDFSKNRMIQKTVLVSAQENSDKCMEKLLELGISTNFELDGQSPRSVAEKHGSSKILEILGS